MKNEIRINVEVSEIDELKEKLTQINYLLKDVKSQIESINQTELKLKISK